ncbi:MAG: glutamine--fructose-6-phosphate transaminase (isomerizing) [Vampirovibrionales bacterium]|nr:glutamine--fructose-6-phosphate transaminase (isomerizing) [Vampirovibrionales bacterium]
MCGIVGYLGPSNPVPLIIESLRCLEYRGYDSAGIALLDDAQQLHVVKSAGKLQNLVDRLAAEGNVAPRGDGSNAVTTLFSAPNTQAASTTNGHTHLGMGHIRWATHGAANDVNAHPHMGTERQIAVVHNGIIENYYTLRQQLQAEGRTPVSETDTECIVQLLESNWAAKGRLETGSLEAFRKTVIETLGQLQGAFALVIMHRQFPETLWVVRRQAPLVIGIKDITNHASNKPAFGGEFVVASDTVAVIPHTNRIVFLKDDEVAELSTAGLRLMTQDGTVITPVIETVDASPLQIDKKGFRHFMLKEIHEQPDVIRQSLSGRLQHPEDPIQLFGASVDITALKAVDRLVVIGCGTSLNAGLVGKYAIEDLVGIPVSVESAGEYRYRRPIITPNTLVVAISQSGETADTLEAVRQTAKLGAKVLTITNREDSSLARESDYVLPVRAGIEVSVCATKSFTAQVVVLTLLAIQLAEMHESTPTACLQALKTELVRLPALLDSYLASDALGKIQEVAKTFSGFPNMLFIARGMNYPVALEGALKLKEISYIHAEGYSGSELKHGPIAMLDNTMPVMSILTPGTVFDKMVSNCQEAAARDARMIAVSSVEPLAENVASLFEAIIPLPACDEVLSPMLTSVPLQLFAYYIAEHLGKDVDQPRNLAKSVTVE